MEREILHVLENDVDNYTKERGSWSINDETYHFIDSFLIEGDGECHAVIVQRESDKKYFQFDWLYNGGEYYYQPHWREVKPLKVVTKTIYGWD